VTFDDMPFKFGPIGFLVHYYFFQKSVKNDYSNEASREFKKKVYTVSISLQLQRCIGNKNSFVLDYFYIFQPTW